MKIFKLFFFGLFFTACTTYKPFIAVTPRTDIPVGSQEFIVQATMDEVKDTLRAASIGFTTNETGVDTEEVLLDEGTKAKYRLYPVDGGVKVVPYWGFTQKVAGQIRFWTGINQSTEELTRIKYTTSAGRPKMVFDYGVQLIGKCGKVAYH